MGNIHIFGVVVLDMKMYMWSFLQNVNMAILYVPRGIWAIYLTPVERAMRVMDV